MAISGYTLRYFADGKSVLPLVVHIASSPPVVQKQQNAWMPAIFSTFGTLRTDSNTVIEKDSYLFNINALLYTPVFLVLWKARI